MANIRKVEGKQGTSYKITVYSGVDAHGKQVRHYKTFTPPPGMSAGKAAKEAACVAFEFERQITQGYQPDNRQTFAEYADYVLKLKERAGAKRRTIENYRGLLPKINAAIGMMKLLDIRPFHLNNFYERLLESRKNYSARSVSCNLVEYTKKHGVTYAALAQAAGLSDGTVSVAGAGKPVLESSARKISAALHVPYDKLFTTIDSKETLSAKTVIEYHRFISAVFAQAEKELIVPYNPASKATPPKLPAKDVNYFQPQEITAILGALENEPVKWRALIHLMIVTGCRRGEIAGLTWDNVDFANSRVYICASLLYSPKNGLYRDTTKTGEARYISLPAQTVTMLRQYRTEQLELRLRVGDMWSDTGYVFTRDNGQPITPDSINAFLRRFADRNGFPHINPHAFRHSMASILISQGQDVLTVSKRLGHAKVSTTTDIYSHVIKEADERASDCIADILLNTCAK